MLYDAHVHLSDHEYDKEIDFVITTMENLGIKACAVSMDNTSSARTIELAKKSDHILPFIGIHPEKAGDDLESMVSLIQANTGKIGRAHV